MKESRLPIKILVVFTLASIILAACATAAPDPEEPVVHAQTEPASPTATESESSSASGTQSDSQPVPTGWVVEEVVRGLEIPWSVVFPSENRILVTERTGAVRAIENGILQDEPLYIFDEVRGNNEAGLMSLALHPDFADNQYVYACYSSETGNGITDRIVRLIDEGDKLTLDSVILDDIPAARFHAGCRLKFGPDGMLYATIGDALQKALAQNPDSLAGKILRITPEGTVPADNPIAGSLVFSLGHRNPQGIDWDSANNIMYSSEHGPSGFDGPGGGDEINRIVPNGNYGWPLVSHDKTLEGTIPPLIQFTPAEAPGSLLFYDSETLPFFTDSLFFGALRGEGLVRVVVAVTGDESEVVSYEKIISDVGRVRDVAQGPDGTIYFTTSNRDGRADAREGDDKIFRIVPVFD